MKNLCHSSNHECVNLRHRLHLSSQQFQEANNLVGTGLVARHVFNRSPCIALITMRQWHNGLSVTKKKKEEKKNRKIGNTPGTRYTRAWKQRCQVAVSFGRFHRRPGKLKGSFVFVIRKRVAQFIRVRSYSKFWETYRRHASVGGKFDDFATACR